MTRHHIKWLSGFEFRIVEFVHVPSHSVPFRPGSILPCPVRPMHHPPSITHLDTAYSLGHLVEQTHEFVWTNKEHGTRLTFAALIQYSTHCYSIGAAGAIPDGSHTLDDERGEKRIFCPIRHAQSLKLPAMIKGFIDKPTMPVELVPPHHNWSFFRTDADLKLDGQQNYRVFFRLYVPEYQKDRDDPHPVRFFVLTAFQKEIRAHIKHRLPFGTVAERTVRGVRVF